MTSVPSQVSKYMGNAVKLADIWGNIIINVKAFPYLAKGDGTTDDTISVQNAVNAAIAAGGGIVYFPPGSYYFPSSSPSINPGIGGYTLEGSGRDSTIILFDEGTSTESIVLRKNLFFNDDNNPNKKGITIRGITFRGTKSQTHYANGGVPLFLDYYSCIKMYRCAFEDLSYMAMDTHYNKQFIATNNRIINISADGFRARDTSNVLITGNYIKGTGDDAIALHIADPTITPPVRESIIIEGNILEDCFTIKVLGGREVNINNNILRRSKLSAIQLYSDGSEGHVPMFNVKIHNNQIIDLLDTDGTAPIYAILVTQSDQPARGGTNSGGIVPTRANASGVFVHPWDWRDINTTDPTKAVPPLSNISIQGNTINRTLPAVAAYSDWGYGSPVLLGGALGNPAITDAILRPSGGITVIGGMHNISVCDNIIESVGTAIQISPAGDLKSIDGLKISDNIIQDVEFRGILFDQSSVITVIGEISNNVLMGDIYRVYSNSSADGSYLANSLPEAINISNIKGLTINNNVFSHWCILVQANFQNDNQYFDNIAYAQIVSSGFSTSNKGIGNIASGIGTRFIHSDMTPSSATYLTVLNATPNESATMPSSGSHVLGVYVKNTNPTVQGAAASRYIVLGWTRITTGSGNVLNTDWVENRVLTGT